MSYLLGQLKPLTFIKGTACKIVNLLVLFVISKDFRRVPEVLKDGGILGLILRKVNFRTKNGKEETWGKIG